MRPQIMAEERNMNYVGIDIGSTASKVVVRGDANAHFVLPTGWSSKETTKKIREQLKQLGADVEQADTSHRIRPCSRRFCGLCHHGNHLSRKRRPGAGKG